MAYEALYERQDVAGQASYSPEARILRSLGSVPGDTRGSTSVCKQALRSIVIKNGLDQSEIRWLPTCDELSTCIGIGIELYRCHMLDGLAAWYGWCFETGGTHGLMISEIWGEWHARFAIEGYMPESILTQFSLKAV